MNPRHAAALALVSWYLMVPPGPNPARAYYTPLSRWKLIGNFDSDAACKKAQAARLYGRPVLSICIASDDLRLKGD
jgi:hypothetical protein